jgi:DNA/RNA-binding protein KIN17
MQMFTENSGRYMDEFSVAFEEGMLEIISRKARSHRVQANVLYRDYIADRNHTHMNSTIWETLTDFVMYLGRTGKCEVDETEKGWFVTYIDRDPEKLRRLEERAKRERTELDSEERHERDLLRQAKVAREAAGEEALAPAATELRRDHPEQKVTLAIGGAGKGKPKLASCSAFGDTGEEEPPGDGGAAGPGASSCSSGAGAASGVPQGGTSGVPKGGKAPAIASLMAEETRRKESAGRKDYWVAPGLVVKVLNKKLKEGKYYKQKGTVEQVGEPIIFLK